MGEDERDGERDREREREREREGGGEREREGGREGEKSFHSSYPEAVALLVDAEPKLLRNVKTVLEAAKKGQPHPHHHDNKPQSHFYYYTNTKKRPNFCLRVLIIFLQGAQK